MKDRIEEVIIKALAERFLSPHPENNLTRAREWVRQHQKEVDIICQLFPQPLDKELRESIIKAFRCEDCVALEDCLTDKPMNFCTDKREHLKGVLALLQPKIEEARRQERERIRARLWQVLTNHDKNPQLLSVIQSEVEALKGGEK